LFRAVGPNLYHAFIVCFSNARDAQNVLAGGN
jgi:hypothetical protein